MPNEDTSKKWKKKLCGASEIAAFGGVTVAQVAHWRKEDWFPEPFDELGMGRVWDYKEVTIALTAQGYPKEAPYVERYPANRKRHKSTQPEENDNDDPGDFAV